MKKVFYHGITSGILAALAASIYYKFYTEAMMLDYSKVANFASISGSSIFGCLLASLGYFWFSKLIKWNTDVLFNALFILLSFASFIGPFSAELPLDIFAPELFVGLSIPMHLFPVLFWIASKPAFYKN